MNMDDILKGLGQGPDHEMKMRIVQLEAKVNALTNSRDAHLRALKSANTLLKECIMRIERLEGPKECKHQNLIGSVLVKDEPLTCTDCGATVARDGLTMSPAPESAPESGLPASESVPPCGVC